MQLRQKTSSVGSLLFFVGVLFSQQASQPISLQAKFPASPGPGTVFRMVNVSDKPISGYVLKIQGLESSGKTALRVTNLRAFNLEPAAKAKAKGEVWDHRFRGTVTAPETEVSVDYVLFQDGTHWGPNSLGQGAKLEGIQQGWASAIGRVKQVLTEKGSPGLVDYLNEYEK